MGCKRTTYYYLYWLGSCTYQCYSRGIWIILSTEGCFDLLNVALPLSRASTFKGDCLRKWPLQLSQDPALGISFAIETETPEPVRIIEHGVYLHSIFAGFLPFGKCKYLPLCCQLRLAVVFSRSFFIALYRLHQMATTISQF